MEAGSVGQIWGRLQVELWMISGIGLAVTLVALFAERREHRRADRDKIGLISWPLVTVIGLLTALVSAGLALKS